MSVPGREPGPAGNADRAEIGKFDAIAHRFWDPAGEFRPLHLINPVRVGFVADRCQINAARVLDIGCGGGLLCEALQELSGLAFDPFTAQASLSRDTSVNYLAHFRRETTAP